MLKFAVGSKAMDEESSAARAALNLGLGQVVTCTQEYSHADVFQKTVPVEHVTDYLSYVDPEHALVCIETIFARTRCSFYTDIEGFRHDYEMILANALAYNKTGRGQFAVSTFVDWAKELLDVCGAELLARRSELQAAEKRFKDAVKAKELSPKTSDTVSSLEALVAACELASEQAGIVQDIEGMCADMMPQSQMRSKRHTEPCPNRELMVSEQQAPVLSNKRLSCGLVLSTSEAARSAHESGPKYRRHKSRVYIRPNKVVYLPTTFMEENFDAVSLPVNCEMIVETNGIVQPDRHTVTIKAVPRNGLSTMYCMTNVMKFQTDFLNWQILNWTRVDENHIKIHLQGPNTNIKGAKAEVEDRELPGLKRKSNTGRRMTGGILFEDGQNYDMPDQEDGSFFHGDRLDHQIHFGSPKGIAATASACLPLYEKQVSETKMLQEQLNALLNEQQVQDVNGSDSDLHRLTGVAPGSLPHAQTLDFAKMVQLLQMQQHSHLTLNTQLPSLPLKGFPSSIDDLIQSLGDQQVLPSILQLFPSNALNFPVTLNLDDPKPQTAALNLALNNGDSSYGGEAQPRLSVQALELGDLKPFKRFKSEADEDAEPQAGTPDQMDVKTPFMAGAAQSRLASGFKRSFDGVMHFPSNLCPIQQA